MGGGELAGSTGLKEGALEERRVSDTHGGHVGHMGEGFGHLATC